MKETVCVTGASGGIAQALLDHLHERYDVRALFRAPGAVSREWERRGCSIVLGDIADDEALSRLVQGAAFVFHCAASMGGPYEKSHAINVEGTRRLARLAAANGCRRFVYTSSIAVYGTSSPRDGCFDEGAVLAVDPGMGVYSLTKLRSETALREVSAESGLSFAILRPTCVYGPHTKPYTLLPLELIRRGFPVIVGSGEGVLDVVYVDDVARAMILAAESPRADREVFNIGHEVLSFNDFYGYYSRMLDKPARRLPAGVPRALVRMANALPGPLARHAQGLRQGAAFLLRAAENTSRFPSSRAAEQLGYAPRVGIETGMLATEVWARTQRRIRRPRFQLPGYGPLHFRPAALAHPRTEEDIVETVRIAARARVAAKAIGSLHSLCPIPETDGVCVVLDQYNKLLRTDGPLVTVQAGIKLRDLNNALAACGLALPVNGSISEQTVSGAISTATHGGSIHCGSLADYVEAVTIVRADGTVVDVDRSHALFPAVVVSLGVLGIMSTVTFRCVPAFRLESRKTVLTVQELIDSFDGLNRQSRFVDMLYFPIIDRVEVLTIGEAAADVQGAASDWQPAPTRRSNGLLQQAGLALVKSFTWLLHRFGLAPVRRALATHSVGRFYQCRIGRSDYVLALGGRESAERSPVWMQDMELAIRYEDAGAAIAALRNYFAKTKHYPLMPIHIRCSSRSSHWLSPAYERDVCWFEFWQYPRSETRFAEIHELMKQFCYRFHWGKETRAGRDYIRAQYTRWDDFVALRQDWDPGGVFLNEYMASFLCEPGIAEGATRAS